MKADSATSAWKVHRRLIVALILVLILLGSAILLVYRAYTTTTLSISTSPNPSQSGTPVNVRGRLTNGLGNGLVGYDVKVESSPDGVVWSELAGPFLTQPSAEGGQLSGTWWITSEWNFSDTTFLRVVFNGDGVYSPSSATIRHMVNSPQLNQYWATFYYPWYCDSSCSSPDTWRHWNNDGYSPPNTWASRFLPDLELYSSSSAALINQHLTWMDDARLDFAIVSWWGQNSFEDRAFHLMLTEAQNNASLHLKLAVYYELEGSSFSQPTVDQIVGNLTYIYENLANSTSYFRTASNHPVVFVYGDSSDSFDYTNRWSSARSMMIAKGEPMFIDLKVFDGYTQSENDKLVDGWHQYRPDVNITSADSFPHYELQPGYSALATPGFWSYREAAPRLNRDTTTGFATAVATMASLPLSKAQFLLIETFNEWHEGTQVEPGSPVDSDVIPFTPSGPSYGITYLEIIKDRRQTA